MSGFWQHKVQLLQRSGSDRKISPLVPYQKQGPDRAQDPQLNKDDFQYHSGEIICLSSNGGFCRCWIELTRTGFLEKDYRVICPVSQGP